MSEIKSGKPTNKQKKTLGAFYTPSEASSILCDWAIKKAEDQILEPSFGGCDFLEQASKRLKSLGSINPKEQLYGCDIDEMAFSHLYNKLGIAKKNGHFLKRDFLTLSAFDFSKKYFDVIVGNPPYISHHNMSLIQKQCAKAAMARSDFSMALKANLWAYFIIHSLTFLKKGGRMAWVLPGSFLFADYSQKIRSEIEKLFKKSTAIRLGERIFLSNGSDENTVILLCETFQCTELKAKLKMAFVNNLTELKELVFSLNSSKPFEGNYYLKPEKCLMRDDEYEIFNKIASDHCCHNLNDFLTVRIGIVTGANSFFVLNQETAKNKGLGEDSLKPILSKFYL